MHHVFFGPGVGLPGQGYAAAGLGKRSIPVSVEESRRTFAVGLAGERAGPGERDGGPAGFFFFNLTCSVLREGVLDLSRTEM